MIRNLDNPLKLDCPLDRVIAVALMDDLLPPMFMYKGWWFVLDRVEVLQITTTPPTLTPTAPGIVAYYSLNQKVG